MKILSIIKLHIKKNGGIKSIGCAKIFYYLPIGDNSLQNNRLILLLDRLCHNCSCAHVWLDKMIVLQIDRPVVLISCNLLSNDFNFLIRNRVGPLSERHHTLLETIKMQFLCDVSLNGNQSDFCVLLIFLYRIE
jgi:hypothetical protein